MSLVKRTYVDQETVITAENLNAIQDAIIENEEAIEDQGEAIEGKYSKPAGGIPATDMASGVQTSLGKADSALQSSDIDSTLTVAGKAADAKKTGDEISDVKNTLNHKADAIYDTASGDIASFPDGADGLPVKDLTVAIEPVQSGTGDPSPTNVRPISGWTGCNISHSGADTSDPTVISISWQSEAGTVYGGTLDVTSGVLTVDTVKLVFDGTENWTSLGSDSSWRIRYIFNKNIKRIEDRQKCSHYKSVTITSQTTAFGFDAYNSSGGVPYVFLRPQATPMSADDWKSFLAAQYAAGTPVEVVFQIESPNVYTLDPVTVQTLLGQNNIWADCGPSTVEYPCDTKLYIQKINTPTDDDMIADANIASGKYFIVNNNLYISTAAILAGDPIKPGTNCTLTNLAAALNAINS